MGIRVENSTLSSRLAKIDKPFRALTRRFLVPALLVAAIAPAAWADTATSAWNGGTTNWATSANWNSGLPSTLISAVQ